jgi:hypothetical protein
MDFPMGKIGKEIFQVTFVIWEATTGPGTGMNKKKKFAHWHRLPTAHGRVPRQSSYCGGLSA